MNRKRVQRLMRLMGLEALYPKPRLSDNRAGLSSGDMRQHVLRALEVQAERFAGQRTQLNGRMTPGQIRKHCRLELDAEALLKTAMEEMGLSARGHDKILRVSRTVADLDGSEHITAGHLSEAINYRTLDRSYLS